MLDRLGVRVGVPGRPARHHPGGDGRRPDGAHRPGAARDRRPGERPRPAGGGALGRGRAPVHGGAPRRRRRRRARRRRAGRRRRRGPAGLRRDAARRRVHPGRVEHRARPGRAGLQRQRRHRRRCSRGGARRREVRGAHRRRGPLRGLAGQRRGDPDHPRRRADRAAAHAGPGHGPEDGGLPARRRRRRPARPRDRRPGPAQRAARGLHRLAASAPWCSRTGRWTHDRARDPTGVAVAGRCGGGDGGAAATLARGHDGQLRDPADRARLRGRACACATPTVASTWTWWAASRSTPWATPTRPSSAAVSRQLGTLGHTSNLAITEPGGAARRTAAGPHGSCRCARGARVLRQQRRRGERGRVQALPAHRTTRGWSRRPGASTGAPWAPSP